jgi:putative transposase
LQAETILQKELTPMAKLAPITEQFQHFFEEVQEDFWGSLYQRTKQAWKHFLEAESEKQRDRYCGFDWYERGGTGKRLYRNGYYERDWVTSFGTIRLRIARSREKNFLPRGLRQFQRRADSIALLIREAFLRGVSTRQVGRIVAILTEEPVSAQTVSRLTRDLDEAVRQFHAGRLQDDWRYLFLDGVSLKLRQRAGRKRVHMLVAYGVKEDGTRQLLGFMRSRGESQQAWEGFLEDLYQRGLEGNKLRLIVTDGCAGLAAAIQIVYPRVEHQRCWVHKMRNILESARRRDQEEMKADAQDIYRADSRRSAEAAFRAFKLRWYKEYPRIVKSLQRDLSELLAFYSEPKVLWRKVRTTNIIERCFVEVRRRTRPMVCFVNVKSVDRIIFSIFNRFNLDWSQRRTLRSFTQAA